MRFESPCYFLLFVPLAVVLWYLAKGRIGREATLVFSYIPLLKHGQVRSRSFEPWGRIRWLSRVLPIVLFILALARPQTATLEDRPVGQTTEFVFTVDVSPGMLTPQTGPDTRLQSFQKRIADFVKRRPYDRFGLVAFAGAVSTVCAVTGDPSAFNRRLWQLQDVSFPSGSAQGLALTVALNRLKESQARSRVVVLISDRTATASTVGLRDAADIARSLGIHVYTIGVGAPGEGILPTEEPADPARKGASGGFDQRPLFQLARETGGVYFRARDDHAVEEIFREIDDLEHYQLSTEHILHRYEYFMWLVWPGLIVLFGMLLFDRILFKKLP